MNCQFEKWNAQCGFTEEIKPTEMLNGVACSIVLVSCVDIKTIHCFFSLNVIVLYCMRV